MQITQWNIISEGLDQQRRYSRDALFTIGNGYFGIRGFFEEDDQGIGALGGLYMAGIFGKGEVDVVSGPSRELCNIPQVLRLRIILDGEKVALDHIQDFSQELNLQNGVYTRKYVWTSKTSARFALVFERFARMDQVQEIWQRLTVVALDSSATLKVQSLMDSNVTNLNWASKEPWPIQPGRDHIASRTLRDNQMQIQLDDADDTVLCIAQKVKAYSGYEAVTSSPYTGDRECGSVFETTLAVNAPFVLEKAVHVYAPRMDARQEQAQAAFLDAATTYDEAFEKHASCWLKRWNTADIQLLAPERDQGALRYNLFELMAVSPQHTERVSIGARGLSGEMYEGCVFWDNEIFQLPFFYWSDPKSAHRMLRFRYHTLPAAIERAKELWFKGALYPWQVSEKGKEQTIVEGGAYYAIHITADIAFAIRQYVELSQDADFLQNGAFEILVQTARFWVSRCDADPADGKYHIRSVRGPNEYDVYVDDSAYTNYLAAYNLRSVAWAWGILKQRDAEQSQRLADSLGLISKEAELMQEIANNLVIPATEDGMLILEDNRYRERRPLDLTKIDTGGKRLIDSVMPYEALPLYQITKQADVVLLMNLFPHNFTDQQKKTAYEYYEPRTAHDSSLSYSPHGLMAARLGLMTEAYDYFEKSVLLDVEDRQMNTVSGIHYANFGGTWQIVFYGFMGISVNGDTLCISPRLPKQWQGFSTKFYFRGAVFQIQYRNGELSTELICGDGKYMVMLEDEKFILSNEKPKAIVKKSL
ncbi:MAG: glycoside hydrolase family 65 protein [Clostridiales bacterium]|nr:glycoside hydrolase family 65 protein [Clostridiales bacterium]